MTSVPIGASRAPLTAGDAVRNDLPGDSANLVETLRSSGVLGPATSGEPFRIREFFRTCEELGHASACAGYLVATSALGYLLNWAPSELRASTTTASHANVTGSLWPAGLLREVADGYHLTGRWPMVPVGAEPDWYALAFKKESTDGFGATRGMVLLPADLVQLSRHGSPGLAMADVRDVSVTDVHVPPDRVLSAFGPAPTGDIRPWPIVALLRCGVTAVTLGLARRALGEFTSSARHRSRLGALQRMAERPGLQKELNRTVLEFRAARQLAIAELGFLPHDGSDNGAIPAPRRAMLAAAMLHAHQQAVDAVRFAFVKAGGSALYTGHPLELCWRNAETLACHYLYGERAERGIAQAQFGEYVSGHLV